MNKYQLGTAVIEDEEALIIFYRDKFFYLQDFMRAARQGPHDTGAGLFSILANWDHWHDRFKTAVENIDEHFPGDAINAMRPLAKEPTEWCAPIRDSKNLICLSDDYNDHVAEMKLKSPPDHPYAFLKPPSTICGSGSSVKLLTSAKQNDWELELGLVIGKKGRSIAEEDAMNYVAGYLIVNDVSARDWISSQRGTDMGIDWIMQKGSDGYSPIGPLFTPADFVSDPQNLTMELTVNGTTMQKSNTSAMIHPIKRIIAHLSEFMTLNGGDIILTGSPAGTGYGRQPQIFLKHGDVVKGSIEGLGTLVNTFE